MANLLDVHRVGQHREPVCRDAKLLRQILGHRLRLADDPVGTAIKKTVKQTAIPGQAAKSQCRRSGSILTRQDACSPGEKRAHQQNKKVEVEYSRQNQVRIQPAHQPQQPESSAAYPGSAQNVKMNPGG